MADVDMAFAFLFLLEVLLFLGWSKKSVMHSVEWSLLG
jgi:hypothetical protein